MMDKEDISRSGPPKKRYAFSAKIRSVRLEGERSTAQRLKDAFAIEPLFAEERGSERAQALLSMHLFHSYAARTDPLTIRSLLKEADPSFVVLDPFVGSGTVLVETCVLGALGIGVDMNALSVRLSRYKTRLLSVSEMELLLNEARRVAESSLERVKGKKRPKKNWDDPRYYEPHVYLELCGLREEIERVQQQDMLAYEGLLLSFSSIVIKCSRQASESSVDMIKKQIGQGQATRWFLQRVEELVRLKKCFAEQVRGVAKPPIVFQGDARALFDAQKEIPSLSVDWVVTSPPYLGVYDYAMHHLRRYAWLNLTKDEAIEAEFASRRDSKIQPLREILTQHQQETEAWLRGVYRAVKPGGRLFVIVGDSFVQGKYVPGDIPIVRAAERIGFRCSAGCTVVRGDDQALYNRTEHLLEFSKPATISRSGPLISRTGRG